MKEVDGDVYYFEKGENGSVIPRFEAFPPFLIESAYPGNIRPAFLNMYAEESSKVISDLRNCGLEASQFQVPLRSEKDVREVGAKAKALMIQLMQAEYSIESDAREAYQDQLYSFIKLLVNSLGSFFKIN